MYCVGFDESRGAYGDVGLKKQIDFGWQSDREYYGRVNCMVWLKNSLKKRGNQLLDRGACL